MGGCIEVSMVEGDSGSLRVVVGGGWGGEGRSRG